MKRSEKIIKKKPYINLIVLEKFCAVIVFIAATMLTPFASIAQVKQLIQIKTFDEQLQPLKNVEVSINDKAFISTGNKGVVFTELSEHELPIKTIKIKNELFETAAWNYSKSILEIVVRKKNYQITRLVIKDANNVPLSNLAITFKGKKTTTAKTNTEGVLEIPLALDEKINSFSQFTVSGYDVKNLQLINGESVLILEHAKPVTIPQTPATASREATQDPITNQEYFKNFDLAKLDSIQSLTVFFAIFKNFEIKSMDEEIKSKLDAKFNELMTQLQDSLSRNEDAFMGRISDSSFVSEDIKNLLNQATDENLTLRTQRTDFDEKIKIINSKLEKGIANLDPQARTALLSDLIALERLLTENESRFYKNLSDYRQIINGLKEKYFDFQNLENQLSESEARRLEEQRVFRQQLFGISAVVIAFALLILLLVRFSGRLKMQKKELEQANAEVKRINENLEVIVLDRTKMLEESNRELDTFLYRASHDLRSPVCSIIGLCNIAIHISDGEPKELVQRVATTTEGMDKLLKKLSIISEINQPTGYSSITLLDIIENVQHKFSNMISDRRINFLVECPADLVFYSYPNLVEAVVNNLIENALFYSVMRDPQNARVEFSATIIEDKLQFTVSDNGIGVDDSIRHRLFDMFFKGHTDSKGNGLGLYIVQKSVQALDGDIQIESETGQYTRFTVQLPLNMIPEEERLEVILA